MATLTIEQLNSNNKEVLWSNSDSKSKQSVIQQIFKSDNNEYVDLASELLKFIRNDDKLEKRNIHAKYVNLLCIALAKSHNSKYLEDIVLTKMCGDLFFYIDSNLLFEFSPSGKRESSITDTVEWINKIDDNTEKWFDVCKNWVNHYSTTYDETVVIQYWAKYKEENYIDTLGI